jgi:glycosyltransferase involved in cell wall biosynthesis
MKILISSHAFAPDIGGIETVSQLLAGEFVTLEQEVVLVTQTMTPTGEVFPFSVLRGPSLGELRRAIKWCDVYWQNNLSLRTFWPAFSFWRPIVITHQGSYCRPAVGLDFVQRLKRAVIRRARSVAISEAVANCFAMPSRVIPNPFDARLFSPGPETEARPNELIFVGRLIAEKGLDLLFEALVYLRAQEIFPGLTIVGDGPEMASMREMTARLGLEKQVVFAGAKRGPELAAIFQRHKILVVPSRYDEPFGVVALEGIASGCAVVGSRGGGLPEAIGPCGLTFPNGDAAALAMRIAQLLAAPDERARLLAHAPTHLARFHPAVIAQSYLELFQSLRA